MNNYNNLMDYNQDCAFNRIHILDDTPANNENSACAIFDGGINVNKNIYTTDILAKYIETDKLKVYGSVGIKNDIKIEGSIYPIINCENPNKDNLSSLGSAKNIWHNIYVKEIYSDNIMINDSIKIEGGIFPINSCCKSLLGTKNNKWENLYSINGTIENLNSNKINVKNVIINNAFLVPSFIIIPETYIFNDEYSINLDSIIIFIDIPILKNYNPCSYILISLPICYVKYAYHKIILSQSCNYIIKWKIPGNDIFMCNNKNQIYEILNITDSKWKVIKYNFKNYLNSKEYYSNSESESRSRSRTSSRSNSRSNSRSKYCSSSDSSSDSYSKHSNIDSYINSLSNINDDNNQSYDNTSSELNNGIKLKKKKNGINNNLKHTNNKISAFKKLSTKDEENIFNLIEVTINNMMTEFNEQEATINVIKYKLDSLINLNNFKEVSNIEQIENTIIKLEKGMDNYQVLNETIDNVTKMINDIDDKHHNNLNNVNKLMIDVKNLFKENNENGNAITRCVASTEKGFKKIIDTIENLKEQGEKKDSEISKLKKINDENSQKIDMLTDKILNINNKIKKIFKGL